MAEPANSAPSRQLMIMTIGLAMIIGAAAAFMVFANNDDNDSTSAEGHNEGNSAEINNGGELDGPQPDDIDAERELTDEEKRRILRRAQEEVQRWQNFRVPRGSDERFAYMRSMERSMEFFVENQLHMYLYRLLTNELPRRREEPAFLVLYGFLTAQTPEPTVQRRALEHLDRAVRADPRFDYALYVSGAVRVVLQQARASRGQSIDSDQLRIATEHLRRATRERPELADGFRALAMAHAMQGNSNRARDAIERAIELEPNDQENWKSYVTLIERGGGIADPNRLVELLERHEDQVGDMVRFVVYGMLGDYWLQHRQFSRAYDFLVEQALPLAHAIPEELEPEQWRTLYGQASVLASRKSPPDFQMAFSFLDRSLDYSREYGLGLYPLVEQYAHVVGQLWESSPTRIDPREKVRDLVEVVFEALTHDSLSDDERGRLVQVLVQVFDHEEVDVAELDFDRSRLWRLAVWLLETYESNQSRSIFDIALRCLEALLPEAREEPIEPEQLEEISSSDLGVVMRVLITQGLAHRRIHINVPSQTFVGRLLQATAGEHEERFVTTAREFLQGPTSPEATKRKANVARVLQMYPIERLADPLITALQRTLDTENIAQVRRLFRAAHPALNAIAEEPLRPELEGQRLDRLSLAEYQGLLDEWRIRFPR